MGINSSGQIVGSNAFNSNWNKLAHNLTESLGIRIKVYRIKTTLGRVLSFTIPKHDIGKPVRSPKVSSYAYPIRDGESLVEMSQQTLQEIFAERHEDWSAQFAEDVGIDDLDERALSQYRESWTAHTKDPGKAQMAFDDMLSAISLASKNKITNAAILLFGKDSTLTRVIPDAEVIFEWRNNESDIAYGIRRNWRSSFILAEREIIELETLREQRTNSAPKFKDKFLALGIIERIGSGKGSKYILSHQYYKYAHDPGKYTRLTGLSRDVKRNIIIEHLKNNKKVTNRELQLAMPEMHTQEITNLLKGMKRDDLIEHQGSARWGHWQIVNR